MLKHWAANRKRRLSALPNVSPYMYDVKISGFTRSSIYIYDISRLRVNGVMRDHSTFTFTFTLTSLYGAVPQLRRLVAVLSLWWPGFNARSVHVGFVTAYLSYPLALTHTDLAIQSQFLQKVRNLLKRVWEAFTDWIYTGYGGGKGKAHPRTGHEGPKVE
jgi:hypothetical protein